MICGMSSRSQPSPMGVRIVTLFNKGGHWMKLGLQLLPLTFLHAEREGKKEGERKRESWKGSECSDSPTGGLCSERHRGRS